VEKATEGQDIHVMFLIDRSGSMDALGSCELELLLHQWAFEGHGAILLDLLHQLGVGSRASEDPLALADQLMRYLDTGVAVLSREPQSERQLEPPPEQVDIAELLPPPLAPPEADADHWIEVVLLDSGEQPIGNERFELVLPDGKVHSGRTDDDGLLRVDPIFKAGNCRLYFPDLQQQLAGSL